MSLLRIPLIFGLFLVLCSCSSDTATKTAPASSPSPAPATAPEEPAVPTEDFTFVPNERFGKITAFTKAEEIPALYGEDLLPTNEIDLGEGEMASGYLLYAGTKNRAEVILPNEEMGMENLLVRISFKNSDWRMVGNDLHVGTTLAELNELNGKPFDLFGYDWDYGGTVTDWKGGKLTGIGVVTEYNHLKFVGENADDSVLGDHIMSSDNPALAPLEVTVGEILVELQ